MIIKMRRRRRQPSPDGLRVMTLLALLAHLSSGRLKQGLRPFAKALAQRRQREQVLELGPPGPPGPLEFKEPGTDELLDLEKVVFRPGEYPPRFSPEMEVRLGAWMSQNSPRVPRWWLRSYLIQQMKKRDQTSHGKVQDNLPGFLCSVQVPDMGHLVQFSLDQNVSLFHIFGFLAKGTRVGKKVVTTTQMILILCGELDTQKKISFPREYGHLLEDLAPRCLPFVSSPDQQVKKKNHATKKEDVLNAWLRRRGFRVISEDDLRAQGVDERTPDHLLDLSQGPLRLLVNGKVVLVRVMDTKGYVINQFHWKKSRRQLLDYRSFCKDGERVAVVCNGVCSDVRAEMEEAGLVVLTRHQIGL